MNATPIPRIKPVEPPYDSKTAEDLEKLMPPGITPLKIFRTLANHPRLLHKFRLTAPAFFRKSLIDPRDREVVIHRTCARCGAEYEWGVHVTAIARPMGFSDEWIKATVQASADDSIWSARERMLIRLVDELHDTGQVSDDLWCELEKHYDTAQLIELVVLTGQYHMISFLVNALRIEREEAGESFPERA